MRRSGNVRVVSIVRGADAGSARIADPALDVNAYAIADEVELTLVLKDRGVELAATGARSHPVLVAGVSVPVASPTDDLRGLIGSGVRVVAVREDLELRGLSAQALVDGVQIIDEADLAALMMDNDVVLSASA
ncbi:MAG: intracellular sulfur oxidation DsrE/DsrF family protein [Glaciecola sp.]|jgi:intracellular sulfur oxidation DsrE/DsrF family protein